MKNEIKDVSDEVSAVYTELKRLAGAQIRMIVPFPAGGPTVIVARPLAQALVPRALLGEGENSPPFPVAGLTVRQFLKVVSMS